jgi:HEAT repeat protein
MEIVEERRGNWPGMSRVEGVRGMLTLFGRKAFEYLVISLWDQDKWVRIAAADALAELQDIRAYRYLVSMLDDSDQDVRFAVAGSLGKLGDKRAVEPLRCACNDENYFVRQVAKESLTMLSEYKDGNGWKKLPGPNGLGKSMKLYVS